MTDKSKSWSRKREQLFRSDIDLWHNACLNYWPDALDMYTLGYKHAGDFIAQHVIKTRRHQDILVYPLIFLYRQYLELRLKELIKSGSLLIDKSQGYPKHHKIDELWKKCREILEEAYPEESSEDFDAVDKYIQQFSEHDPTSIAFRYPTDKKGKKSLPGITHINLRNFSEIMNNLASLLDAASVGISYYLDLKGDMESSI